MINPVVNVMFGGDPELFFEKGGKVIGAEKVIPAEGLRSRDRARASVVLDGVQVELNPQARNSVNLLGQELSIAFSLIQTRLKKVPGVKLCYDGVIEVDREELDSLSPATRILGCKPSRNMYGDKPITVDAKEYRKRSAGGHHHYGLNTHANIYNDRSNLVPLLDMFLGSTCVMLDRDPGAAERRENYGRAGEHRLPAYGLEYRTLSNWWLRNYTLTDFVYGMGSVAIAILADTVRGGEVEQELIDTVDISKFIRAIDLNDFNQAYTNFKDVIRPFLVKHLPKVGFPLNPQTVDKFLVFAEGVEKDGLVKFFPQDPIEHWVEGKQVSFAEFIEAIY